jgi:hypothetical protein
MQSWVVVNGAAKRDADLSSAGSQGSPVHQESSVLPNKWSTLVDWADFVMGCAKRRCASDTVKQRNERPPTRRAQRRRQPLRQRIADPQRNNRP